MTEKDLNQFGLLEEFSITELEQRLEFEAWCDGNCGCTPVNGGCVPINSGCEPPPPNDGCEPPFPDEPCIPQI
jgi:hypothetical protein